MSLDQIFGWSEAFAMQQVFAAAIARTCETTFDKLLECSLIATHHKSFRLMVQAFHQTFHESRKERCEGKKIGIGTMLGGCALFLRSEGVRIAAVASKNWMCLNE